MYFKYYTISAIINEIFKIQRLTLLCLIDIQVCSDIEAFKTHVIYQHGFMTMTKKLILNAWCEIEK